MASPALTKREEKSEPPAIIETADGKPDTDYNYLNPRSSCNNDEDSVLSDEDHVVTTLDDG